MNATNLSSLLELNRLPQYFEGYNGVLTSQTYVQVVEQRLHDFTRMQIINGRRVPTVTNSYLFERVSSPMSRIPTFDMLHRWAFAEQLGNNEYYIDQKTDERLNYHPAKTLRVSEDSMRTIIHHDSSHVITAIRRESIKTQSGQTPYRNTSRPNISVEVLSQRMGISVPDFNDRLAHEYKWTTLEIGKNNYGINVWNVMDEVYGVSVESDSSAPVFHTGKNETVTTFVRIYNELSGEQIAIEQLKDPAGFAMQASNRVDITDGVISYNPSMKLRVGIGFTIGSLQPMRQYTKEVFFNIIEGVLIRI